METVNTPSPGMFAFVLRVLSAADSLESSESASMKQLSRNLTRTEAHQLPYVIGEVLGLLRGAPTSLQYASDLIVAFNLHEAASNLVDVTLREADARDRRLLLNAASICGHPSVPEDARARIAEAVSEIPAARIRLDSEAPASNERMRRLQKRCWPGLLTESEHFGLPPTVVLDSSINRLDMFTIGCALHAHGYAIRRIGEDNNLPEWFGNRTTVICAARSAHRFLSELDINENQIVSIEAGLLDENTGLFDKDAVNKVLAKVWEVRPSNWKPDASAPMFSHATPHRGYPVNERRPIINKEHTYRPPFANSRKNKDSILKPQHMRPTSSNQGIPRNYDRSAPLGRLRSKKRVGISSRYQNAGSE